MPRCEGNQYGPCPKGKIDSTVKLTQGDLMCCPACTETRFPSKGRDKPQHPETSSVGNKQKVDEKPDKKKKKTCICNEVNKDKFMIRCDWCYTWYHGDCVCVKEGDYKRGEKYKCKDCAEDQSKHSENENNKQHQKQTDNEETEKEGGKEPPSDAITTTLLKLHGEVKALKSELERTKHQQLDEKQQYQEQLRMLQERMQQQMEEIQINNAKAEKELNEEREKSKQHQEENRKQKVEIGKLKVAIKGKEDENRNLIEEIVQMQREVNITKKEMELTEIRTTEQIISGKAIGINKEIQTETTQVELETANGKVEERRITAAGQTEASVQTEDTISTAEQQTQTVKPKERWIFNTRKYASYQSCDREMGYEHYSRREKCKYYATKNGCKRGYKCWYRHDDDDDEDTRYNHKQDRCKYYSTKGGCNRGQKCWYRYDEGNKTRSKDDGKENTRHSYKQEACRYYNTKGGCNRGRNCWYRHEEDEKTRHRPFLVIRRV